MTLVAIHPETTNLLELLARAEAGEDIVLARDDQPVARLVPLRPATAKRRFGALRGRVSVGAAFFEPLPQEELNAWDR